MYLEYLHFYEPKLFKEGSLHGSLGDYPETCRSSTDPEGWDYGFDKTQYLAKWLVGKLPVAPLGSHFGREHGQPSLH